MKNLEAEQLLLGSLINNNSYLAKIQPPKEYFSEPVHQELITKILAMYSADTEINLVTLDFDKQYLLGLINKAAGVLRPEIYYNIVKDLYERRKLKEIMEAKIASLSELPAKDILESLNAECAKMQTQTSNYRLFSYDQVICEIAVDAQNYSANNFTSTGFTKVDISMNGGLERGKTYALSAEPKAGKTMMKGTIANHLRKSDVPFLFVAAEMGRKEITKRIIGQEANIGITEMNKHNQVFCEYLNNQSTKRSNMYFLDAPRITLEALKISVTNAVKTKGIQGFILDYLQLVTGKDSRETIAQHQENVAQGIAELCRKENIWCLYSCQINRGGEIRNGDGILMAVDWLYEIKPVQRAEGLPQQIYLEHIATRNMRPVNIGSEVKPSFELKSGTNFIELL